MDQTSDLQRLCAGCSEVSRSGRTRLVFAAAWLESARDGHSYSEK